jgi:hypothetical protein
MNLCGCDSKESRDDGDGDYVQISVILLQWLKATASSAAGRKCVSS